MKASRVNRVIGALGIGAVLGIYLALVLAQKFNVVVLVVALLVIVPLLPVALGFFHRLGPAVSLVISVIAVQVFSLTESLGGHSTSPTWLVVGAFLGGVLWVIAHGVDDVLGPGKGDGE